MSHLIKNVYLKVKVQALETENVIYLHYCVAF